LKMQLHFKIYWILDDSQLTNTHTHTHSLSLSSAGAQRGPWPPPAWGF